jgi:hypothetical protein
MGPAKILGRHIRQSEGRKQNLMISFSGLFDQLGKTRPRCPTVRGGKPDSKRGKIRLKKGGAPNDSDGDYCDGYEARQNLS